MGFRWWAPATLALLALMHGASAKDRPMVDATKLDVRGVRLFMTGEDAEAAMKKLSEYPEVRVTKFGCYDHINECYSELYAHNDGSSLKVDFEADLPDHPERSLVKSVELRYSTWLSNPLPPKKADFIAAMLGKYGEPTSGGAAGGVFWWGTTTGDPKPGSPEWSGPKHPYLVGDANSPSLRLEDPQAREKHDAAYKVYLDRTRPRTVPKL